MKIETEGKIPMTTVQDQLNTAFLETVNRLFPEDFLATSPESLEYYGKDWTKVYPPAPGAVVFPRTTREVADFLKLCHEHHVAVVPSGGRTGLSGGAVAANGEVVLSLERMNRMDPVDLLSLTVRVQAGAITESVHQHCEPYGLTWPIDFGAKGSSQIGGNISTNAGGAKVIRYGLTRNWVSGLQVVTMDGNVLELNGSLQKNNTGLDLCQLFIGTEGTLGIVTEATLKLTAVPKNSEMFFFALDSLSAALELLKHARLHAPSNILAFEYLTHPCLDSVVRAGQGKPPFSEAADSYVLIELESPGTEEAGEALQQWLESVVEAELVLDGVLAQSPKEKKELWALRENITESLTARGLLHKNDIALPIPALDGFVSEMQAAFQENYPRLDIFLFGHLGDGNFHVNIMKPGDMDTAGFSAICREADEKMFQLVQKYAGSVSAEHGIGLLKKKALAYSRTPEELAYFRQVKQVFDPKGLLNPGKIID